MSSKIPCSDLQRFRSWCDISGSVSKAVNVVLKFRELFGHKPARASFNRAKFNQISGPLMQTQNRQPQVKGRGAHDKGMARASRAETLPSACAVWKVKGKNGICRPLFLPCTGHLRLELWLPGCLQSFCHFFPLSIKTFLPAFSSSSSFFFFLVTVCSPLLAASCSCLTDI